jgi:hypothetical protein
MNPTATETVFFRPPHDVLRRPATAIRELDRLDAGQGPAPRPLDPRRTTCATSCGSATASRSAMTTGTDKTFSDSDHFTANMALLGLPAPKSLFQLATAATGVIAGLSKAITQYGSIVTLREIILTMPAWASAAALSERAVVADWHPGRQPRRGVHRITLRAEEER